MSNLPSPEGLVFDDWAYGILQNLEGLRTFPLPRGEAEWRNWAEALMTDEILAGKQILGYNVAVHWQEWAASLVYAMENA